MQQQRLVLFTCLMATAMLLPLSSATSCPPVCNLTRCPALQLSECKAGRVRDFCHCCYVCAKALGESCGGLDNAYGTCASGLECFTVRVFGKGVCIQGAPPTVIPHTTATSSPTDLPAKTSSIATAAPTAPVSSHERCLQTPKCTLDFCSDNRNKMCSVNSTDMLDKDESADSNCKPNCYITSCKACVFVEDLARSPCDPCDADDAECMIAYGLCVNRYMRFITVTPLGNLPIRNDRQGRLLCKVPIKASATEW